MTFNPLLKEDPHLVVFKKANKHCNPAASVCKPNPQGRACAKSFCRHPSILLPFHHAAQSLHPVSPLREYMRQLRPDYDVISKNIGGVTLPAFTIQPMSSAVSYITLLKSTVPQIRGFTISSRYKTVNVQVLTRHYMIWYQTHWYANWWNATDLCRSQIWKDTLLNSSTS